jgi:hypothetical protein
VSHGAPKEVSMVRFVRLVAAVALSLPIFAGCATGVPGAFDGNVGGGTGGGVGGGGGTGGGVGGGVGGGAGGGAGGGGGGGAGGGGGMMEMDGGDEPSLFVILYADPGQSGAALELPAGYFGNLAGDEGSFEDIVSSVEVPEGLVLYGFAGAGFIGTVSDAIVGPAVVDLAGADADVWSSAIVRPADEPYVTTYADIPFVSPKRYPIGQFATLGALNNQLDGLDIPEELAVELYEGTDFVGPMQGPFVGAQMISEVPIRDTCSSFIVRLRESDEPTVSPFRFYVDDLYEGDYLVLMPGRYPDLNNLGRVIDDLQWIDRITSYQGPSDYRVWGFDLLNYGGDFDGPRQPDVPNIGLIGAKRNDWFASMVIQAATDPVLDIEIDGSGSPVRYPLVDVADMAHPNDNDAVWVPPGYVVYGYVYDNFGGCSERHRNTSGLLQRYTPPAAQGGCPSMLNNWDSFQVRPIDEPTVDLYFAAGRDEHYEQTYPLGSYRDLEDKRTNATYGVEIPCGVTLEAFDCDNYCNGAAPNWTLVGPMSSAAIGSGYGQQKWDSMRIYRNGDDCE